MTGKQRIAAAMRLQVPDRVPVMCQLSLGHYFLNVDLPVYVHTCGAIGDRLELLLQSGFNGVDTLDPPPLGDVQLADAVKRLHGKAFIKGNIDPVNTLLKGTADRVRHDAKMRTLTAGPGGGYILSSACSVAPRVPPENMEVLAEVAREYGRFNS